jgi:ketoreductase
VVIDVADPESVANGVEAVVKSCGRIDALINCAGIGGGGPTIDVGIEDWKRIIETNLNGTFYVTQAVLKASAMLKNKWGRIINIASTGGKQGVMFASAYSASKHGVVGLTKSLGLELAKTGITVNAVCPGFVETELAERARTNYAKLWGCSPSEAKTRIENRVPLGRYIEPQELCGIVRYLLSNESRSVLAQAINVCGGLGNY